MFDMFNNTEASFRSLVSLLGECRRRTREREKNMTPEEKLERERLYKAREEKRRHNDCIVQGKCPDCLAKLVRGKKDKHNGYKRAWVCVSCNKKYNIED